MCEQELGHSRCFRLGMAIGRPERPRLRTGVVGFRRCKTCGCNDVYYLHTRAILRAIGIGEGDEVTVPDFTHPATALVVMLVRATPILVDVDRQPCNACSSPMPQRVRLRPRYRCMERMPSPSPRGAPVSERATMSFATYVCPEVYGERVLEAGGVLPRPSRSILKLVRRD